MAIPLFKPKILTLTAPYDSLDNAELGAQLIQIFKLKLAGYRDVYEYGVLPVDTYDFISTHHLIGLETRGPFKPLMAFRTVEVERCALHGLVFPGLMVLRNSKAELHAEMLEALLEEWSGLRVSYASSWAAAPELRADREMRDRLRDMMVAALINHELDRESDHRLLCGVPKVHTDLLFERYGYDRVRAEENPLPPFEQASLMGEEAVLLHCAKFNEEALRLAGQHRNIWDQRLVLGAPVVEKAMKKAA